MSKPDYIGCYDESDLRLGIKIRRLGLGLESGLEIWIWDRHWVLGLRIVHLERGLELGIGISIGDRGLGLWIEKWNCGMGLEIGIGN